MDEAEKDYYTIKEKVQDLKSQIHLLQSEVEDREMEIRNLKRWKSGRWIGFVLMAIATIVLLLLMLPYTDIYSDSIENISDGRANMVNTSISATALIFGGLLLLVVFVLTVGVGIKTVAELGKSGMARKIALSLGRKNYYASLEPAMASKIELERALFQLRMQIKLLQEEMAEKEKMMGSTTLDFLNQSNYNDD